MNVSLVMVKGDGSKKEAPITKLPVVIGRDEGVKFRIPTPAVSRKHCELLDDDGELVIKDLGSSNGTYVNGKRIKQTELSPGDLLAVGGIVFVVKIDGFPKEIDAKDCYAAGLVGEPNDEDDEILNPPKPAPSGPSRLSSPMAPGAAKPGGGAKKKDDDEFDLKSLLEELGDDDEETPPKKK